MGSKSAGGAFNVGNISASALPSAGPFVIAGPCAREMVAVSSFEIYLVRGPLIDPRVAVADDVHADGKVDHVVVNFAVGYVAHVDPRLKFPAVPITLSQRSPILLRFSSSEA